MRKDPDAPRRAAIAAEVATGKVSLQAVGDKYGITRERVRQIAVREGVTVRGGWAAHKAVTREKHRELARMAIDKTDAEVAAEIGVSTHTVADARQRWGVRRNRAQGDYHGTMNGYSRHKCRCDQCMDAMRTAKRRHEEKDPPVHGTANGYINYRCRCDLCRAAGSINNKQANERRRARRKAGLDPIPEAVHGTLNGYQNWYCRCAECGVAWRGDLALRRAERAAVKEKS